MTAMNEEVNAEIAGLSREIEFVLDRAPSAICYVDRNQRYRYVNARFCTWAEADRDWIIGRVIPDVIGVENYERIRPAIERALGGRASWYEEPVQGPDGRAYWLRGAMVPDVIDGDVRGYVILITDITRRKMAEITLERERRDYEQRLEAQVVERTQELRELQKRLVAAERLSAAEEMAGVVAHAVNNPLTALLGTVEMAQQGMIDPRAALERVRLLAKRIEDVVQGTLRMFRRGEVDLRQEAPEVLVERVRSEIVPRALKRDVAIICRVEPALPTIFADRTLLGSALTCIAENALQASPKQGRVWLEAEQIHDGRIVRIRISDEGPGIPVALRSRVIEPFFTTKSGGTGLGLAIATGVIQGHGGSMRIEDRPGGGASVSVDLLTAHMGVRPGI
jgi:PAS domain S-box-containing protein